MPAKSRNEMMHLLMDEHDMMCCPVLMCSNLVEMELGHCGALIRDLFLR